MLAKNLETPEGEFSVLLMPTFFGVLEKEINKFCFEILNYLQNPQTLHDTIKYVEDLFELEPGSSEHQNIEKEVIAQFRELLFSETIIAV